MEIVIDYVRTCLTSAPRARTLWALGFGLATLAALPVAFAAILLAPSAAALLFTGNLALASDLAPGAGGMPGGFWAPVLGGLVAGGVLWSRPLGLG